MVKLSYPAVQYMYTVQCTIAKYTIVFLGAPKESYKPGEWGYSVLGRTCRLHMSNPLRGKEYLDCAQSSNRQISMYKKRKSGPAKLSMLRFLHS
jgi:hypothetical protein